MKHLHILFLVIFSLSVGCGFGSTDGDEQAFLQEDTQTIMEEDKETAKAIQDGEVMEARDWLKDETHFLGEREISIKMVDELYRAGAIKVWVMYPEEFEGNEYAEALAAELPATDREQILKVPNFVWDGSDEFCDFCLDVDQKYLVVWMD